MLIKVLQHNIGRIWDLIKEPIRSCLPPIETYRDEETMNSILESLLNGTMDCWILSRDKKIICIVTTTVVKDMCSKISNLLIYSLFISEVAKVREEKEVVAGLKAVAKKKGCKGLIGYTKDENLLSAVRRYNGSAEYRYIIIPIDREVQE